MSEIMREAKRLGLETNEGYRAICRRAGRTVEPEGYTYHWFSNYQSDTVIKHGIQGDGSGSSGRPDWYAKEEGGYIYEPLWWFVNGVFLQIGGWAGNDYMEGFMFPLPQELTADRVENPRWTEYVTSYNALYHDYHMSDGAIVARLGPEPPRYLEPAPVSDEQFQADLEAWEDLLATQHDASWRAQ